MSDHRISLDMLGDVHFHSVKMPADDAAALVSNMDSAADAAGRCVIRFPLDNEVVHVNMNHALVWYSYETNAS